MKGMHLSMCLIEGW